MPHVHPLSESIEEYLEAVHRLGDDPTGISTTSLARRLKVTPASVTGMLRRLRELGLITYHRYHAIALTEEGQRQAHDVIRRHRLAERLLTDLLKVPLDQAHEDACRLEHVVTPQLGRRIAERLGQPKDCPHGHPLDLESPDRTLGLSAAPLNVRLIIARLDDESPEVVRGLSERKLVPGARVVIRERDATMGTLVLESNGVLHTLGETIAQTVRVHPPRRSKP